MLIALILGAVVAMFNVLLSLIAKDWNIAFVLSGTVAIISIVITSILKNSMVVFSRKTKAIKEEAQSFMEAQNIAKMISIFGFPSIVITIVLFFRLYGLEYLINKLK